MTVQHMLWPLVPHLANAILYSMIEGQAQLPFQVYCDCLQHIS